MPHAQRTTKEGYLDSESAHGIPTLSQPLGAHLPHATFEVIIQGRLHSSRPPPRKKNRQHTLPTARFPVRIRCTGGGGGASVAYNYRVLCPVKRSWPNHGYKPLPHPLGAGGNMPNVQTRQRELIRHLNTPPPLWPSNGRRPEIDGTNAKRCLAIIRRWSPPSGITPAASRFMSLVNAAEPRPPIRPTTAKPQPQFREGGGADNRHCLAPRAHPQCCSDKGVAYAPHCAWYRANNPQEV